MAASDRTRTLVRNLNSRRRISWVPPNGREMDQYEQVNVPGVLETLVALGEDGATFDHYVDDLDENRVEITKVGYGET